MTWRALAVALAAGALAAPAVAENSSSASSWQLDRGPVGSDGVQAVAIAAGRWAVGDARGVLLRGADGSWERLGLRSPVRDVAYAPDGSLWIAAEAGLWRFDGERLEPRVLAPGEESGRAIRLAVGARWLAVACEDGVHWSLDGQRFERIDGAFGESPPGGLALAEPGDGQSREPATLWIASERGLWRARLPAEGPPARVGAERVELPPGARPALDVRATPNSVMVLGLQVLAEGEPEGGAARLRWRVHRPELPPGATPTRLAASPGALWIATDRGIVEAARPGGPWQRAGAPAGSVPTSDVASDGPRVLAASARGLLVGRVRGSSDERSGDALPAARPLACDPPIAEVQRAVLAHLDLGGDRIARMWWGVRRRGLMPIVTLEGGYARDFDQQRSWDQSFVSGAKRYLFDRDRDADHKREISLKLIWDLGDTFYNDQEIDVSSEQRRLIALRDDVLDEVNQLYFDRLRALEVASAAPAGSPEAVSARRRADELTAGLDGWSGAWFGARAGRAPCPAVSP